MFRRWFPLAGMAMGLTAAASAQSLGTVTLPVPVMADGRRVAVGTYQIRLTSEVPQTVLGQSPDSERWVEFVSNGVVAGRELATVLRSGDIDTVVNGPRPPANGVRIDVLRGGDYVRVWLNRRGEHYLIHVPPAP